MILNCYYLNDVVVVVTCVQSPAECDHRLSVCLMASQQLVILLVVYQRQLLGHSVAILNKHNRPP